MFGYIIANTEDLSQEEKDRFRRVYCGLCRELGKRCGQLSRFSLNYDMTFLVLLLSALYEPKEEDGNGRCIVHPVKRHEFCTNQYTSYAADMTVALTYYKCIDDWKDDRNLAGGIYASVLKSSYRKIRERWPRHCSVIETAMSELNEIEENKGGLDEAANCFGRLMEELFVYSQDIWEKPMRQFGNCLGRFIYIMDAAMDCEEDKKSGSYNPLLISHKSSEEAEEIMRIYIGTAATVFEKLPLVEDVHLLQSVLYAGVWQKYLAKKNAGKEESDGSGSL